MSSDEERVSSAGAQGDSDEAVLEAAGRELLGQIGAWLALQSGEPARALRQLDVPSAGSGDSWYLRGCAHEGLALDSSTPAGRREALEAALRAQRASLGGESSALREGLGVASPAKVWVRVATLLVLLGEMERAGEALAAAQQLAADSVEVKLLAAEHAVLSGEHRRGMLQVLPLLDERPDGWVLAALAAAGGQLSEQMERLLGEAEARLGRGFVAPHRRERLQDARALLGIVRARPQPGQGPYGQLGALMSGSYERVAGGAVRGADRALVKAQLRALLLAGRTDLLVPLLDDRAESLLPGIGEVVRGVVGGIAGHLS